MKDYDDPAYVIIEPGRLTGPFHSEQAALDYVDRHQIRGHRVKGAEVTLLASPIGPSFGTPTEPRPVHRMMCSECGLPWSEHQERAEEHWWDKRGLLNQETPPSPFPVTHAICVSLLLEANRGPEGPQGPQGQSGRDYWEGMP